MSDAIPQGLTHAEAARALARDGPNVLNTERRRTFLMLITEVVREPMFLLLLAAGSLYLLMGDTQEAIILLGFVTIIITITVAQARRTERALLALRDMSSPRALVLREGTQQRIAGRDVVRGDVLLLAEGDRIAADGDVLQAHELAVLIAFLPEPWSPEVRR